MKLEDIIKWAAIGAVAGALFGAGYAYKTGEIPLGEAMNIGAIGGAVAGVIKRGYYWTIYPEVYDKDKK